LLVTFLALTLGVYMQNFSPLFLKLREEFEVTDTHGLHGKKFKPY